MSDSPDEGPGPNDATGPGDGATGAERGRGAPALPSFERFTAARIVSGGAYRPDDGAWIAYLSNATGQTNLWAVPSGGGFAVQLTAFTEHRVTGFEWAPDGGRVALLVDHHGDEMHQIWVLDVREDASEGGAGRLAAGWPRALTARPDVQFGVSGWLPDGSRIVAYGNDREPTEVDPFLLDPDTGEVDRLVTGGLHYAALPSPDGRTLPVVEFVGNTEQRVRLLDLGTREVRLATPEDAGAKFMPRAWSPDGDALYLTTDHGREFEALAVLPAGGGEVRVVHAPERDVEHYAVSRGGRFAVAAENEGGASVLRGWDLERGEEIPLPGLPLGVVESLSPHPKERRIVVTMATPREMADLVEIDLATGERTKLEQSMLGGIDPETLPLPEPVTYPSFDRDIPAWLYRPEGEGPFPVVLSIHGGPESQERPTYAYLGLYAYLLSRGIGILAPNIRGSTGYGISYQKLIHRDWGGDELRDIEAASDWLRAQDWVDPERIAVFGGSFGGFATLSAMTRLPDRWRCGVDLVGPANLVTFVESVPPHWRGMMKAWVGDAEEDREMLIERSPITRVDAIRAPLLVMQGANDPRVVKAESDQMVAALRERGLEVDYWVDEEGGHGPANRERSIVWFGKIARYLEERLVGSSSIVERGAAEAAG